MAKGKKSGGKSFVKGESGNVNGRPILPQDLLESRKLNKIEVSRIISKYMNIPICDILHAVESPDSTALESVIAKLITEAHKHGDHNRLNFLFDRMIGKVTDKVELTVPKPTLIRLINGEAIMLGTEVT